jgi:hypothetical protein
MHTACKTTVPLFVCFLAPGSTTRKPIPDYGILARPYDPQRDTCCTVYRLDGSLKVHSYKEIDHALRRLNNKDEYCPLKKSVPERELENSLKQRKNVDPPLASILESLEGLFRDEVANAIAVKTSIVNAKPKAPPKAKSKKKKNSKAAKKMHDRDDRRLRYQLGPILWRIITTMRC